MTDNFALMMQTLQSVDNGYSKSKTYQKNSSSFADALKSVVSSNDYDYKSSYSDITKNQPVSKNSTLSSAEMSDMDIESSIQALFGEDDDVTETIAQLLGLPQDIVALLIDLFNSDSLVSEDILASAQQSNFYQNITFNLINQNHDTNIADIVNQLSQRSNDLISANVDANNAFQDVPLTELMRSIVNFSDSHSMNGSPISQNRDLKDFLVELKNIIAAHTNAFIAKNPDSPVVSKLLSLLQNDGLSVSEAEFTLSQPTPDYNLSDIISSMKATAAPLSIQTETDTDDMPLIPENIGLTDNAINPSLVQTQSLEQPQTIDTVAYAEQSVHMNEIVSKIAQFVAQKPVNDGNVYELKMRLMPQELGEVFLKISYNKGNVALNLITDTHAAQQQILSQSNALRTSLAENDFNLLRFDVGTRENYSGQDQSSRQRRNAEDDRNNTRNIPHSLSAFDTSAIPQTAPAAFNRYGRFYKII